jgi:hypothetical protein
MVTREDVLRDWLYGVLIYCVATKDAEWVSEVKWDEGRRG